MQGMTRIKLYMYILHFKVCRAIKPISTNRGCEIIKLKNVVCISPDSNYALKLLKRDPFWGLQALTRPYKSAPN